VVDLATIMTTHLSEIIRRHSHELVGRQEIQKLLDRLKDSHPKVVEELIPNLLSLGGVVRVLQNLLREQVPIRDLLAILETLGDWAPMTKDLDMLTEYVRQSLSRTITKTHQTADGQIAAITLGPTVETAIAGAIQPTDLGPLVALEPSIAEKLMQKLARSIEKCSALNHQPLVVCSGHIRAPFKRFVERFIPNLVVLSYNEILSQVEIRSLAMMELSDAD
ncbi:MAG: FHIPEP family type III secretion protein, partial [Desulfobacterales bacterium]